VRIAWRAPPRDTCELGGDGARRALAGCCLPRVASVTARACRDNGAAAPGSGHAESRRAQRRCRRGRRAIRSGRPSERRHPFGACVPPRRPGGESPCGAYPRSWRCSRSVHGRGPAQNSTRSAGPRGNHRSRPRSDLDAGELAGLGQRPTCLSTSPPLPTSPRPSTNSSGANQPPGQNPAPLTVTGNRRSRRPRSRTATHLLAHHPGPTTPIPGAPDGPPQLDGDHHRSRAHKRDQRRRAAARHSRADDRLGPQLTDPRTADAERKRHLHSERARSPPTTGYMPLNGPPGPSTPALTFKPAAL
jgi:hypothetical protein